MNGIDAAIAAAQQSAANVPADNAAASGTTAVAQTQDTAISAPLPAAGKALGLADAMTGTHIVDEWLKVNEHGLQIGGLKPLIEEFKATIDMTEVAYTEVIKFGNPALYEKTYDRVLAASGKSWAQAVADARRVDPKARPYNSADASFVLTDDIKLKDKTVEAGTVLGHSFSTTGWKAFAKLVKQLMKDGIDPQAATVALTVGYSEQSSNGNTWGILDFRDVKEA